MLHLRLSKRIVVSLVTLSLAAGAALAADLWTQLGVTEQQARTAAVSGLTSGHVAYYMAGKAFRAANPATRAALVTDSLKWVRTFVGTPAFKSAYDTARNNAKPKDLPSDAERAATASKDQARQAKELEAMKQSLAQLPPDQRKQIEDAMKQMEAQNKAMQSDPKMAEAMKQLQAQDIEARQKGYQESFAAWQRNYPADPAVLIARRLREFLDISATVDFKAALTKRGAKMVFVDPALEGKPDTWKVCFRAGRESVDAARAFATAWLAELPK